MSQVRGSGGNPVRPRMRGQHGSDWKPQRGPWASRIAAYKLPASGLVGVLALVAMLALSTISSAVAAEQSNGNVLPYSGTTSCELRVGGDDDPTDEWHWVINSLSVAKPASITAYFDTDGDLIADDIVTVFLASGGGDRLAHYYHYENLTDTLLRATVDLDEDDFGNFNLSHAPCTVKQDSSTTTDLHDTEHGSIPIGSSLPNGSSLHDSATVVAADGSGPVPTGTVTFLFFQNGTCTGDGAPAGVVALDDAGVADPSDTVGPLAAGDYSFLATYNGDVNYNPSTADCEPFHVRSSPTGLVSVTKDAATSWTRECEWRVNKTADPTEIVLGEGDSEDIDYLIEWRKRCSDGNYTVTGEITIINDATDPLDVFDVTAVSDVLSDGTIATVDCDPPGLPHELGPGESLVCTYTATTTDADAGTNVATATVDGVEIDSAPEPFTFSATPTSTTGNCADIEDQNLEYGPVNVCDSGSTTLTDTISFNGSCTNQRIRNTATVTWQGPDGDESDTDTAVVGVRKICVEVTKTAETSYDQVCEWDVEKSANPTSATVDKGATVEVDYEVAVTVDCDNYENIRVSGKITVKNTGTVPVNYEVTDDLQEGAVVCSGIGLAAGASVDCNYDIALDDLTDGTNIATATISHDDHEHEYTGSADYVFGDPDNVVDACVTLTDSVVGDLNDGEVLCAVDAPFEPFTYSLYLDAPDEYCETTRYDNTAQVLSEDGDVLDEDTETVVINTFCEGCTPGYWKNHPGSWPAPYTTSTTLQSVFGANALSGTLLDGLNFGGGSGVDGAKRILLRAAVAALLNAAHPDVNYELTKAEVIAQVTAALNTPGTNAQKRAAMLALAAELDEFNNRGCPINAHGVRTD